MQLNEQQEEAANHRDGPCLVIAVPGSGKTRLLVERVGRLIESGVPANQVVSVTFTNKAADEMKERVCKRLGVSSPRCFVGTFHRLCVGLLRKFGDRLGYSERYTIVDADDQKDIIRQVARSLDKTLERQEVPVIAKVVNDYRENIWTRDQLDDAVDQNDDWIHIIDEYIERLAKLDMIDFSGLLYETIRLLESHQDVRERIQKAMRYIMVDESQDTNIAQFRLIEIFAGHWNNVFLVGDPSQSIYRFRSARYENIRDFLAKHKDCVKIELPLNYRSTPQIVGCAEKLIKHNASHMAEEFITENKSGEPVRCLVMKNQYEEGNFVSKHISKLVRAGGWRYGDVAVLYRMNSMAEPIERAMTSSSVPYKVIGGRSFYDRREIKDCLAMLRFASNPKDGIAFHRCCGVLPGVGEKTIAAIENMAMHEDITILDAANGYLSKGKMHAKIRRGVEGIIEKFTGGFAGVPTRDVLADLVDRFDFNDFLDKKFPEDSSERAENVQQLVASAGQYADENNDSSISSFLQSIALISSSDDKEDKNRVSLMTLHASKGLEFPIVFVVGVEQNMLPHGLSLAEDPFEGLEEERRLCYVGMTRAMKVLFATHCQQRKKFGRGGSTYSQASKPSQFLLEAGLIKKNEREGVFS